MRRSTKLMLMQSGRGRERYKDSDYYYTENRTRDDRGREHYDNGRYAPMRNEYRNEYDSRYDNRRYYRDNGYRSEYGNGAEMRRGYIDFDTDVGKDEWYQRYDMPKYRYESRYDNYDNRRVIGFNANGGYENRYDMPRQHNEMENRTSSMERGHSESKSTPPLTKDMAEEWMEKIHNEDGTKGAHWTFEEVKRAMQERGLECDPMRLWVAVNAEYSDRYRVNRKHGVDNLDFYIDSAVAFWLKDADAVKDKEAAYYTHIVKH